MVLQLRKELGHDQGTVGRVARQLGIGVESLRSWVRQREIDDGVKPGVTSEDAEELKALRQEVKELRRANEILKKACRLFSRRSSTAHRSSRQVHRRPPRRVRGRAHLPGAAGGSEHVLRGQKASGRAVGAHRA
jgi:transposase